MHCILYETIILHVQFLSITVFGSGVDESFKFWKVWRLFRKFATPFPVLRRYASLDSRIVRIDAVSDQRHKPA